MSQSIEGEAREYRGEKQGRMLEMVLVARELERHLHQLRDQETKKYRQSTENANERCQRVEYVETSCKGVSAVGRCTRVEVSFVRRLIDPRVDEQLIENRLHRVIDCEARVRRRKF